MILFETKRTRHAAAAGFGGADFKPHFLEKLLFGLKSDDGFMMAMALDQGLTIQAGGPVIRNFLDEKLAEQIGLGAQAFGVFIVRKKVQQFIAKNSDTARLQSDHGNSSADLRTKRI